MCVPSLMSDFVFNTKASLQMQSVSTTYKVERSDAVAREIDNLTGEK